MSLAEKSIAPDYAVARRHMIESQIRPNNVKQENVLRAMETVPREIFVAASLSGIAYIDKNIEVSKRRYLLEPRVLAKLLDAANVTLHDHVLDVAPATGYSTAILAYCAKDVVALDSDIELETLAQASLSSLSINNVKIVHNDLTMGYAEAAPYNVILINGSVDKVPDSLFNQLAEDGRLLTVVREFGPAHAGHVGEARLYSKIKGYISYRPLFNANVEPLIEFQAAQIFTF